VKTTWAQWESECPLCGVIIDVGDDIVTLVDEAVHADCAEMEGVEIEWL